MTVRELILYIVQGLVDNHQAVSVNEIQATRTTVFELAVARQDLGKIIGRQGRTIDAIRTLLQSISVQKKRRLSIQLIEHP